MAELYEVVVFTAGVKDVMNYFKLLFDSFQYADAVLNILDPHGYITHRLYRHHTTLKPSVPGVIKVNIEELIFINFKKGFNKIGKRYEQNIDCR